MNGVGGGGWGGGVSITWRNLIETHQVKLHAKFGSPYKPYGFWQEDFQRFKLFLIFVIMATRVFEGIKFFQQEILKRTMAGTFLWNIIKIGQVVSEKRMFKEKVDTRKDGWTDGRTTDNEPWHKLTGLWPVELKMPITSIVSFSHTVFKRLLSQSH